MKLKILLIHNCYKYKGGEDTVFELEHKMLLNYGNEVKVLLFDNNTIVSVSDKFITGINYFYNLNSAKILEDEIKSFLPDVIHVHNFFHIASPSIFFVAKKYNIPIIKTLHNYRLICSNALLFREGKICEDCINKVIPLKGIVNKCYRNSRLETTSVTLMTSFHKMMGTWKNKVDHYIALSEFARDKYINSSLHISSNQISVKPNFVEDFGKGNQERENFFLFIGRLSEEKRIRTILDSLSYHKYKVKIIGDGPYREMVERECLVNDQIEYFGFQKRDFIIDQLKKAQALLFTSIWYEGMPMIILEAFSTGTPVISTKIGILSTLIKDDYNGFHFIADNAVDLAEKIKYFETNVHEMKHLYSNARQTYLDNYTPEINYKLLIEIYSNVIKQKDIKK